MTRCNIKLFAFAAILLVAASPVHSLFWGMPWDNIFGNDKDKEQTKTNFIVSVPRYDGPGSRVDIELRQVVDTDNEKDMGFPIVASKAEVRCADEESIGTARWVLMERSPKINLVRLASKFTLARSPVAADFCQFRVTIIGQRLTTDPAPIENDASLVLFSE